MRAPITSEELSTLDMIAAALSKPNGMVAANLNFAETLRRAAFAVREYQRVSPAEERAAWTAFGANIQSSAASPAEAARWADGMLKEWRERFGDSR